MLTDEEYREVVGDPATLYFQVKSFIHRHGQWAEMKHPAADRYLERTGVTLHHTSWLLHVRRSDYGPIAQPAENHTEHHAQDSVPSADMGFR
jgi:hypothetical protein